MGRTIKSQWAHLKSELWDRLERRKSGKMEMYIELYRFAANELRLEPEIDAYSDPALARTLFREISPEGSTEEKKHVRLVEGFYKVLRDEFSEKLGSDYLEILADFLLQRNLRYTVTDKGKLVITISGLLAEEYDFLREAVSNHAEIKRVLDELEEATPDLHKHNKANSCIRIASLILEGIAVQRAGSGHTLAQAAQHLSEGDCFPHKALAESLKKIYGFLSDYPNIRHAGNPDGKLRELKCDDALLLIALAVAYSAFLCEELDAHRILE